MKRSRKLISIFAIFFVTMAAVFCCCSQVMAMTHHDVNAGCCHKNDSGVSLSNSTHDQPCHCQKTEGVLSLNNSEYPDLKPPAILAFLDIHAIDSNILLSSSLKNLQEASHRHSSAVALYLQISVLRI